MINLAERGFPYSHRVIMTFIGGSKMYLGPEYSKGDTDYYGVFVEPLTKVMGLDSYEHFTTSTKKPGQQKNTKEDDDVCFYGLQRFAELACKGNPTVLSFLFAPTHFEKNLWNQFTGDKSIFLAKSHLEPFFGYANAQLQRLYNGRGPKDVSRPFLEAQFGYDTKYAMHIVRLILEAKQLMMEGKITYPSPDAGLLYQIRAGECKLYDLEKMIDGMMQEAREAQKKSSLPERVDREVVSQKLVEIYLDSQHDLKYPTTTVDEAVICAALELGWKQNEIQRADHNLSGQTGEAQTPSS